MLQFINQTQYIPLNDINRPDIFLKLECNQFGNSFKARGVCNFLNNTNQPKGLVTFTTGNHGIAVAAIAKEMGIKAIIISTNKLSEYKKALIESYGATVKQIDNHNLDTATEFAKLIAVEMGFCFVPLYDNEFLLEGYCQISHEIINDFEGALSIYFPVGSASLLFANSKAIRLINGDIKVIAVEPKIYQRLNGDSCYGIPSKSIADSLSIDRLPTSNSAVTKFIDKIIVIEESEIIDAMRLIYQHFNLITEPGGAITLAAAFKTDEDSTKKIAVITGKNISTEKFNFLIQ